MKTKAITFEKQMIEFLLSALSQRGSSPRQPDWVPAKVRLNQDLRFELADRKKAVVVSSGEHYCQTNVWGAMMVAATCGKYIGVTLDECEIVEFRSNEKKRMLQEEAELAEQLPPGRSVPMSHIL